LEGNTKGAILVVTYERWHTTTYIGVGGNAYSQRLEKIDLINEGLFDSPANSYLISCIRTKKFRL